MMQSDLDMLLNDLLVKWHIYCAHYQYGKGYPSSDVTCRQSRTSKQYDYDNGAMDANVDNAIMEAFDAAMDKVEQPWRTALSVQARNLHTGSNVWSSPRLPSSVQERVVLLMEARNKIMKVLARDGILS